MPSMPSISDHKDLRINGDRLWRSIMEMGDIGETPNGGSCRLALTDEDKAGRDLFKKWCLDEDCAMDIDTMGNMFFTRRGKDNNLVPIATGSHLDTQPHGGKFDGIFGVLAGLEVIRTLNEHNIETAHPIEVINWSNEEGSRFAPAMLASGVYANLFDLDSSLNKRATDGALYIDELKRIGYHGSTVCGAHKIGALFEAHIEQGPILEANNNIIGIVTGGQGQRWYDIAVKGQDSHSGSTPMKGRKDALSASARMILEIERIALKYAPSAVGTVGQLDNLPNSRNTIPGEVKFTVDLRHPDNDILKKMSDEMIAAIHSICEACDVISDIDEIWVNKSVKFDEELVGAVEDATSMLGYAGQRITSGAGHDAIQVARVAPAAMIFVPCKGGISHNESESAKFEDLEAGANVLLHAMLAIARA